MEKRKREVSIPAAAAAWMRSNILTRSKQSSVSPARRLLQGVQQRCGETNRPCQEEDGGGGEADHEGGEGGLEQSQAQHHRHLPAALPHRRQDDEEQAGQPRRQPGEQEPQPVRGQLVPEQLQQKLQSESGEAEVEHGLE